MNNNQNKKKIKISFKDKSSDSNLNSTDLRVQQSPEHFSVISSCKNRTNFNLMSYYPVMVSATDEVTSSHLVSSVDFLLTFDAGQWSSRTAVVERTLQVFSVASLFSVQFYWIFLDLPHSNAIDCLPFPRHLKTEVCFFLQST